MATSKGLSQAMKQAIRRSGYLLEQTLVPVIERHGYKTTANHRFLDPISQLPSEIDIFAVGARAIDKRMRYNVFPVLLVECKNLQSPIVVFTQSELRMKYFLGSLHVSGLPTLLPSKGGFDHVTDILDVETFHHYFTRARVASQFCVVGPKKPAESPAHLASLKAGDLSAGHKVGEQDLYLDGVRKLSSAVLAERYDHADSWAFEPPETETVNLQLYFPILFTSGPLYECFIGSGRPRYRRVHRIGLLHRRIHGRRVIDDRIDVVDPGGFRALLRVIEHDLTEVCSRMKTRKRRLVSAVRDCAGKLASIPLERRRELLAGFASEY
jgi:hypothetical protein